MRKLALLIVALSVVAAASLAGPFGASAAGSSPTPTLPGPRVAPRPISNHLALAGTPSSVASSTSCDETFHAVTTPNGANNNYIFATAAVSSNDVWAVGISNVTFTSNPSFDRTLAEHWNGTSWSIVPTPNPSGLYWSDLNGVTAISSNDVWAVGDYQTNSSGFVNSFSEHWNGTSWTMVNTVNPMSYNYLLAVNASPTGDVWAVGTSWSAGFFTLTEHFTGSTWVAIPSPNQTFGGSSTDNLLFSVSAFAATDVWAVGRYHLSPKQSLAEHYNGSSWSIVTTPNGAGDNEIAAVNALEAGHAVGVGSGDFITNVAPRQRETWDLKAAGSSTNAIFGGPGVGDTVLEGVDRSGSSVWAVGYTSNSFNAPSTLAIPATWNAAAHTLTWGSIGTAANPSGIANVLYTVSAVSPYAYWAGGFATNASVYDQTLMEGYCAFHFSLSVPTSTPAGTPFSMTLTTQNGSGATVTNYLGTVHFSSSDPLATLPADYTFVPGDNGVHTFTGVVLDTPCSDTITAADMVMPLTLPVTVTVGVVLGACQAPPGTAGSPGVSQAPSGTSGGLPASNQSPAGNPGIRLPRLGGTSSPAAAPMVTAPAAAPRAPSAASTAWTAVRSVTRSRAEAYGGTSLASTAAQATMTVPLAARSPAASPPAVEPPWLLLVSLLMCLLALAELRRRKVEGEVE